MKKITTLAVLLLLCLIFPSCTKYENPSSIEKLEAALLSLELDVYSGIYQNIVPSLEITNTVLFDKINKLRSVDNEKDYLEVMGSFEYPSKSRYPKTFSLEEELIFKSLFNLIRNRSIDERINICDLYLSEIPLMNLKDNIEDKVENIITLYRDLNIFHRQIEETKQTPNNSKSRIWDCPYKTCFDCCYSYKMQAIEDGNIFDFLEFLVGLPFNVTLWGAACTLDCIKQIE